MDARVNMTRVMFGGALVVIGVEERRDRDRPRCRASPLGLQVGLDGVESAVRESQPVVPRVVGVRRTGGMRLF